MQGIKMFSFFKRFFKKQPFEKYASGSLSLYDNKLRVIAEADTKHFSINGYKVHFLPEDSSSIIIGETIIQALKEYITGVKYPKDPEEQKKLDHQMKKNMQITSWRKYTKEAKVVSFSWNGENLKIYPIIKKPGFYTGGGDKNTRIVDPNDPAAVGPTARELLQNSK
jgi:hypothetical protein